MTRLFVRASVRLACLAAWAGVVVTPTPADTILYIQPTNLHGAYASQNDTSARGLGNFATAYDDFSLPAGPPGYTIDDVQWIGSYFFGAPVGVITAFTVNFYANKGGIPGALLPGGSFSAGGNAGQTCTATDRAGNITCSYLLSIPDFALASGATYWLSIVPSLALLPQWGWETGTGGNGRAYTCFFGTCGTGSINGTAAPNDLAFELSGQAIPEPSSGLLVASALLALVLLSCKKKSMKPFAAAGIGAVAVLASMASASAQTWIPLTYPPSAAGQDADVGAMLQLRDGRILVHQEAADRSAWLILTPDVKGSYVNGTWSDGGSMASTSPGYAPLYFGSQVLLNGRQVVIEGGEYNDNDQGCEGAGEPTSGGSDPGQAVWTSMGAIGTVTPFSGPLNWTSNAPPSFFTGYTCPNGRVIPQAIGDGQSVILANGRYMQANALTDQNAIFNGPNQWLMAGSVNQRNNDEAAFTLLTNDMVLTVDTSAGCGAVLDNGSRGDYGYELYDQSTGVWSCGAGPIPFHLYTSDRELGAAVLMYNNKVIQFGGSVSDTAIYDVARDRWTPGPLPPPPPFILDVLRDLELDQSDGPAALEPNGKVLAMLSPGPVSGGNGHCQFVEYDPSAGLIGTFSEIVNPAHCYSSIFSPGSDPSYVGHLMILPTGQIMFTDFTNLVQVYNPAPEVVPGVAATIFLPSTILYRGSRNNILYGYQLNGLTQNNGYGDDYQADTDFPLARLTCANIGGNACTAGNVYYAFTHDDSTHSIKPGTFGSTLFDLPANMPPGTYQFVSVTNGIQSNPIGVDVR